MTATDTRADWLAWRREGVGASDVAAILGLSPWASPWSVWADKAGLLPDDPGDEYMAAGRWLESAIGPWFEHETGLTVAGEQTTRYHPLHPHHRCTLDGFVFESGADHAVAHHGAEWPDALGLLEIKITGTGHRWDEIPAHYQTQGQWQMHVCGLDRVWFAVLMGRRLDIHELARDQADIDLMVERVDDFWHVHVQTGEPPPTDGSDATARALAAVYPQHTPGKSVEVDPRPVEAWLDAKAELVAVKAEVDNFANRLRAELADAEEGTVGGERAVSWRTQHRKSYVVAESDYRVLRHHPPKETNR